MEMAKVRFLDEDDRTRGVVGLGKRMSVVGLRGGYYVVPASGLALLDEWGCSYEVVERGGYDALVGSLRGAPAGTV
jgi:aspartate/methionine/tyrosine aminotransferase